MTFSVSVPRSELLLALKTLANVVKRERASEAVLSLSEGILTIDVPGGSVGVPAEGSWPGTVRVSGQFLLGLSSLPGGDPLRVRVEEGRLRIAGLSTTCSVEEGDRRSIINLPLDAPLIAILRVSQAHSDDEIARSGLTPLVRQAEERCDELIVRAIEILEPLGVEAEDLKLLINDCINRKYA